MRRVLSLTFFACLEAGLIWMLTRLAYGSLSGNMCPDLLLLGLSLACTTTLELGLLFRPESAKAKTEVVRAVVIYSSSSMLVACYVAIGLIHPDWLRGDVSAIEHIQSLRR